ncbi:MAG TPA: VOC family protein, partial [Mycobacterium sp.]
MSDDAIAPGSVGYLQLPTVDLAASQAFYSAVFGWQPDGDHGEFVAPGIIGQWTTDLTPAAASAGAVIWIAVDGIYATLSTAVTHGGQVRAKPWLDGGERWLAEVNDPSGNRLGVVSPVRKARSQTMLMVRDVQASSRWYQQLLGLASDHGGPEYERLLSDGDLVLQLHHAGTEHHHGPIGNADVAVGNGVLVWFGEVADFDGVVARAAGLRADLVKDV